MTKQAIRQAQIRRVRLQPPKVWVADRPLTLDDYLRLMDEDDLYELVDGMLVERTMAAVWHHEQLFGWMMSILSPYVEARQLGYVAGSRSAVKISEFRSRLPDLLFIRKERAAIITESVITGAPDWVLEIRSRANNPAEWRALEVDYRSIGVPELWLVDPQTRLVRVVRQGESGYEAFEQSEGRLESVAIPGFWLETSWLFFDTPRPSAIEVLKLLGVV
jgi:Uma2 family endonuclease